MTFCRYCVITKNDPNMEKNTSVMAELAALNRGFSNTRTSSIGWSLRRSQTTNPLSTAPAMT